MGRSLVFHAIRSAGRAAYINNDDFSFIIVKILALFSAATEKKNHTPLRARRRTQRGVVQIGYYTIRNSPPPTTTPSFFLPYFIKPNQRQQQQQTWRARAVTTTAPAGNNTDARISRRRYTRTLRCCCT